MAFQFLARRSLLAAKQSLTSALSHSYGTAGAIRSSSSPLFRLRPLAAAASASCFRCRVPGFAVRSFITQEDLLSLDEPIDHAKCPPKEQILIAGCDFEHWFVLMDDPEGDPTRDEIIDSYIKTLAKVVGSEEEARMKMYSVSTRHYYAYGAVISEELSEKVKGLPGVRWVLPDSYLDPETKNYGGEPFINGEAVPYDPKYHEDWLKSDKRDDGPPKDGPGERPRSSGQRRGPNSGPNAGNFGGVPNMAPPRANAGPRRPIMGGQQNFGGGMPPGHQYGPGPNSGGAP